MSNIKHAETGTVLILTVDQETIVRVVDAESNVFTAMCNGSQVIIDCSGYDNEKDAAELLEALHIDAESEYAQSIFEAGYLVLVA